MSKLDGLKEELDYFGFGIVIVAFLAFSRL